jgi:hypothetical protein
MWVMMMSQGSLITHPQALMEMMIEGQPEAEILRNPKGATKTYGFSLSSSRAVLCYGKL